MKRARKFTRSGAAALVAVWLGAVLSACSTMALLNNEIVFSYREINERLEKRFPLERDVGGLLKMTLSRPRLDVVRAADGSIAPGNRLSISFDISVALPLSNKTLHGSVVFSGVPRYEATQRRIFLSAAKVERIRVDSIPSGLADGLVKAATNFAREALEERPLHILKPEDLARYNVAPTGIEVRDKGLALLLR